MGKPGQTEHTGPASQREDVEGDLGKEPACVTACMTIRNYMHMVPLLMLAYGNGSVPSIH